MATETKTAVVKLKPSSQVDGSSKGRLDNSAIRKKIVSSSKHVLDSKPKSITTTVKSEVKSKAALGSSKSATTTTITTKVKQKKVYTLPGQRYDPPEEREPLRIFYESLSKQIPSSEMAEFWMMEHGLLSPEGAKKAYERKQRRQKEVRTGTPSKSSKPPSRPESSHRQLQQASKNGDVKAKKRIMNDSDDDDFILSPKRRKV
ncbi:hypothetical protein PanWU01x14_099750 [Parasponia andersonii]|uniref:Uncharacterized protein n=1 Tax=Parasponia andersonii TaxID=3476 RepID=A0A2P5D3D4_PARAD|nr:hypothetical protein PanWU01x14_099750 [Parasponia andersonii]